MRSIVVRKRANEDWLAPKPIPNDLARVEAFALELLPDRLAPLDRRYCNQTAMPAGLSGDHRDDRARGHSWSQDRDQAPNENRLD